MPAQLSRADALVPAVQRVAIEGAAVRTVQVLDTVTGKPVMDKLTGKVAEQRRAVNTVLRGAIVVTDEWDDPSDTNDTGQKKAKQVSGYRRADPLLYLHTRGEDVTADHIRAANRFRDDYEMSEGACQPGLGSSADPMGPQEIQFRARDNYRAAIQAVGIRLSEILVQIVLLSKFPTAYAEENGLALGKVIGYLTAALDRLQEHYEQGRPPSVARKVAHPTR